MGKVKCYIDAENLSVGEVLRFVDEVKGRVRNWEELDCKIYGRQERLDPFKGLKSKEIQLIETAATNGKKTADVTIVTHAAIEAVTERNVSVIWLLTKDCDFKPLVDTLTGLNFIVKAPLLGGRGHYTVGDVDRTLRESGWDPMAEGISAFYDQKGKIRSLLGDEFSDELIDKFLERKKKNFLKEASVVWDAAMIRELQQCKSFNFQEVVNRWSGSLECLERLAKCYTTKFYNLCFRKGQNRRFVQQMLAER